MTTTKKTTIVETTNFTKIENLENELKQARLEAKKQDKKAYKEYVESKAQKKKEQKAQNKEISKAKKEVVAIKKDLKGMIVENNKLSWNIKKSLKSIRDLQQLVNLQQDLLTINKILKGLEYSNPFIY